MRWYGEIIEHDEMIGFTSNYRTVQKIINLVCEECLPTMQIFHPEPERIQEIEDVPEGECCCMCDKAARGAEATRYTEAERIRGV